MGSNQRCDFREHEMHVYFHDDTNETELCFFHNHRIHRMLRQRTESMIKTCSRLSKKFSKGKIVQVTVSLNQDRVDVSSLTNADWKTDMTITIDGVGTLGVVVNCPVVQSIHCFPTKRMRVGSPVVPCTETKFSSRVQYSWYCKHPDHDDYLWVSDGGIFWPGAEWVHCAVKVYATPLLDSSLTGVPDTPVHVQCGRTVTLYLPHPLCPETPSPKVLEVRQDFLESSTGRESSLRIMTYNILANAYATSPHAISDMYSYVVDTDEHLAEEYRGQLIVKELLSARADVICLQECDRSLFLRYLQPVLAAAGYAAHFTQKEGPVWDGCASFIRSSSLRFLCSLDVSFRTLIGTDPHLQALFSLKPDIHDYLVNKIGSIGQISVVQSMRFSRQLLLLGNTHLFYHPLGCHVRLLQGDALLRCICELREDLLRGGEGGLEEWKRRCGVVYHQYELYGEHAGDLWCGEANRTERGSVCASVVLLGDMNSSPQSVWVQYLQRGIAVPSFEAWGSMCKFSWERSEHDSNSSGNRELTDEELAEFSNNIIPLLPEMSHDLRLISAAGYPPFTNYTRDFKMTLDYIFIEDDKLQVVAVAPLPSEGVLSENMALPSAVFPSDHISLIVDIDFKPES